MARIDKVYTRFRGVVASDITGIWGDDAAPDLACVIIDSSGELIVSTAGNAQGVIWTPEGKSEPGVANYNVALAGSVMTVLVNAELTGTFDEDTSADAILVGESIWSGAAGTIVNSVPAAPTQLIGFMAASASGDPRVILNIGAIGDVT